jgi:GT2 family glycosyltransferase
MLKPDLSIVILNYNTADLLEGCLQSLQKVKNEINFEVIVVDNGSTDNSTLMIRKNFPRVRLIENRMNLGYAKGNNCAKDTVRSDYILFLNSDTLVKEKTLRETLLFLKKNGLGAVTCKLVLPDGTPDKDARRSVLTPLIGLIHLFLKLDIIFPRSKIFAKYWYGFIPENEIHEVDAIQGAYFLTSKIILDKVGWFDEDYFLDGEDLDLCWKIKKLGYKIFYYPKVSIIHIKGATKGKNASSKNNISFKEKLNYKLSGVNSMEIFYRKRLWGNYPIFVNYIVILGIKFLKIVRAINVIVSK